MIIAVELSLEFFFCQTQFFTDLSAGIDDIGWFISFAAVW